ncbi:ZYRO0G19712p [Zygosaccharomyces rouxii]|uniref:ZYRO0G19712p n=1 Tax=Zygosaccharomyces rouxii (strain ATCC 2623 / CBS 732 / NBRC 1130 / NCYC 568 / NRRL Y-229) TaxID=559307 RepID=C5E1B7_ZYGRC|nr:uncharacterized protein ZYRO0G19712g [Zygosaccharomyces rouxii]KAH9202894.1 hypothetical protein LQ764DRAFT_54928 [Zygosaccharomyces rouxii]CAR29901.1 ZYRO0G19712p [Zygosaccharomyces rouxii]
MNFFSVVLTLGIITGVFADSTAFRPVVSSASDAKLNGLTIYASGGAIILGDASSNPTVSHLTDCGAFAVSGDDYAGTVESGLFSLVGATQAAFGFTIHDGKLTYKDNAEFYAIQQGSGYRLAIYGGTKITIDAQIVGGDSIVSDFSPSGVCHGQGPQKVSSTSIQGVSSTDNQGNSPDGSPRGSPRGKFSGSPSGSPNSSPNSSLSSKGNDKPDGSSDGSPGSSPGGRYQHTTKPAGGGRGGKPSNSTVHRDSVLKRVPRVSISLN